MIAPTKFFYEGNVAETKPPLRRQRRQLPSMGAEKPLFEERCHEVTERWQMRYNESRGQHLDVPHMLTVGATIGRPLKKTQKGRPMIATTKATL